MAGYHTLLADQGNACAICRATDDGLWPGRSLQRDGWHIDHDHETGEVRGVLCPNCNLMLGYARDNPSTLQAAIAYLSKE